MSRCIIVLLAAVCIYIAGTMIVNIAGLIRAVMGGKKHG